MNRNYSYKKYKYKNLTGQLIFLGQLGNRMLFLTKDFYPGWGFIFNSNISEYDEVLKFTTIKNFKLIPEKIVKELKLKTKKKNNYNNDFEIQNHGYVILYKNNPYIKETLNSKLLNILNR